METLDLHEEDSAAKKVAYIIYILYLCSLMIPVLPIIAVIFAYIFENDTKNILKSHYQYLIRSFWMGMLYFSIAGVLVLVVIGVALVPLCIIWWVIRMAKGLKSLLRNEPISYPKTWLF
jgi:uncharacterized membrane protein